ncbi:MAG: leucine-rich repeat domain-containing protein [Alistipes sp.]|nr:leucine-rich repeat domain-containing protein [Alistipes sp.]
MKRFLVILAALAMVLPACETNEEIDKPCNHSWVDGVCTNCGEDRRYIDATAMSAEELGTAMREMLASGITKITVNLVEEPTDEMYKALRRALIETSEVEDGSIDLTIQGAKVVGEDAFGYHADGNNEYVSELRSITLTDATIIKDSAFYACDNLISFSAPNVTEMGDIVFVVCENIKDVYLPNLREMGRGVFSQCSTLEKIALPELTTLSESAFGLCRGLKEVNLPKVSRVMDCALEECLSLERVTFGTPIVTLVDPFIRLGADESEMMHIADALRRTTLVLSAEQTEMVMVNEATDYSPAVWERGSNTFPFGSSRTFIGYEFKSITAAE